jgi:ABC-type transporter Mla subunit MlaD
VRIDVDTQALAGLAGAVRRAASAVGGFADPVRPEVSAVAAEDAVRMLLRVAREQRDDVAGCLRGVAALVETAAADYARAESQAVR